MNGDHGPILDRNNIINVRDGESLYQICIKLRRRLSGVPGFRPYLEEMEEREAEGSDPVSSLWQCFRSGLPLLTIYNASNPEEGDLHVDTKRPERVGKEAAFLFIKACMQQMEIPAADTFTVTDLYSDNTTGFVKVTKLINRVLDILRLSGKLHPSTDSEDSRDGTDTGSNAPDQAPKTLTRRQHILKELVETERQYVHHLQNLQALKKELEDVGALTGDAIHNIFLNLNNLLDFAQRFLIRIEQQNETADEQQNWGRLFVHYKDPFRQYEPFIANQRRCETTCGQEWDRMVERAKSPLARQMLANPTILNGFLLKPFQRLTKYPLLLKDLQNQIPDPSLKSDLTDAIAIIQDVLMQADASIDKETRDDALQDLQERIDDWKQLNITNFGEILLLGTFNVMKESGSRSDEKEYHIYLFTRILIMCKDVNANKPKNRLNNKPSLSRNGKPKMNLKGRIYFTNVISVSSSSSPGSYSLQISWKGETGTDTFIIKFKNDDTLQKWHTLIETQRSSCMLESRHTGTTSDTQLLSLQGMNMENPYLKEEEDDDYSRLSGTTYGGTDATGYSEFNMSRNASSTSLRSRSATGGSGGSNPHLSAGRMRVPTGDMGGLSLNTRGLPVQSPQDSYGGSYFSPIERESTPQSTMSARSSSQSAFSGYHRGATPVSGGGQRPEDSYRNTAPALARNANGHANGNPYLVNGRNRGPSQGPGMPPPRMRSASSPDVHPMVQQSRKYVSGEHAPSVPPIPAHMAKQMAPPSRSQNNSPNNGPPSRGGTPQYGLPQGPRPGMQSHGYTYDNSYANEARRPGHAPSLSQGRTFSPPVSSPSSDGDGYIPSQLKAKVCFDENYVSMIIASNIQFRSLADRIDAKLARFTNHSIASGSVRLRYRDEDGDFILIDSDEAVHEALLDWHETHPANAANSQNAELLLYAHAGTSESAAG
ncbi:Guanine nucleotide exchange factor for Cdc42p [Exophiala xenobiotica]